jgi:hypothetical protein
VENESLKLWHHAPLFHQASCGREACGGRRGCCFPRCRALTLGRGAGLAWRILSVVQYLRVSSEGVSSECFMIVAAGAGFEKRFHASRYTPTSKQRRIVPTRGSWTSLCCRDIMALSFRKDDPGRTRVQDIMHVVFLSARSRSSSFPGSGSGFLYYEVYHHLRILRRSAKNKNQFGISNKMYVLVKE